MENIVILKNQQYPEEIVEHGIQKALEKGPIHTELREQVHVTSNQNNIILLLKNIFFVELTIYGRYWGCIDTD
jgi:predicted N-acyltransferase